MTNLTDLIARLENQVTIGTGQVTPLRLDAAAAIRSLLAERHVIATSLVLAAGGRIYVGPATLHQLPRCTFYVEPDAQTGGTIFRAKVTP